MIWLPRKRLALRVEQPLGWTEGSRHHRIGGRSSLRLGRGLEKQVFVLVGELDSGHFEGLHLWILFDWDPMVI